MPFLFLLFVVCYLDRINIGFAALTMNKELAITSQQYGLLSGIFFFGYFCLKSQATFCCTKSEGESGSPAY
jgi:sugar phosphate permease